MKEEFKNGWNLNNQLGKPKPEPQNKRKSHIQEQPETIDDENLVCFRYM